MSIVAFVAVIGLIGLLAYGVSVAPFISAFFKTVIYWGLGIAAVLITLDAFGVLQELRSMQMPHI